MTLTPLTEPILLNVKTICKMFYPNSNRSKRWDAIQETLGEWVASRPEPKIWNNSLRSHIYVGSKTRRELPYWGSKNPQSTEAICKHFSEIMRFAVKKEEVEPHSISGKGFTKLIILEREIKGFGTAKLTVGVNQEGRLMNYCITVPPAETAMA